MKNDRTKGKPVGGHDDDAFMLLNFREEHVDVVATMLLPVLKDGFTFIKEQQSIMDLRFPTGSAKCRRQLNTRITALTLRTDPGIEQWSIERTDPCTACSQNLHFTAC